MSWPTDEGLVTDALDSDTDRKSLARPALLAAVQKLKQVILSLGHISGICELDERGKVPPRRIKRGEALGVCELNAAGKVPTERVINITSGGGVELDDHILSHGNTSTAQGYNAALDVGKSIRNMEIDEYGHVTYLDLDYMPSLEVISDNVSWLPIVSVSGTWKLVQDEVVGGKRHAVYIKIAG